MERVFRGNDGLVRGNTLERERNRVEPEEIQVAGLRLLRPRYTNTQNLGLTNILNRQVAVYYVAVFNSLYQRIYPKLVGSFNVKSKICNSVFIRALEVNSLYGLSPIVYDDACSLL